VVLKRQISKWAWLLWALLPLVLLFTEAAAAVDGASAVQPQYRALPEAINVFGFSQGARNLGATAIIRAYPPPQPNGSLEHPGSGYFPGAALIFIKQTALTGQGYAFLTLVIGLFAHFYSSARNNAGFEDGMTGGAFSPNPFIFNCKGGSNVES
jgi:hypothetical protein